MQFFFDIDKDRDFYVEFILLSIINLITLRKIKYIKKNLSQLKTEIKEWKIERVR